jgi:dipeptidyl aminopeptidase/acylaminoacyl peptidase
MEKDPIPRGRTLVKLLGSAALCLAAALAPARAAEPAELPAEKFFQRPAVLEAKLSPSGTRIAITTSRGVDRVALVVMELQPGRGLRRVALFKEVDVVSFDWAGEERLVFNVRDLQAGSGEDRYAAPGLYVVNADGSELRQLVKRRGTPKVRGASEGSRREALEWNHVLLHVPLPQEGVSPDEVVIGEWIINGNEVRAVRPLWLNVKTGRTRRLELGEDAPLDAGRWLFDSQGRPRLAIVSQDGRLAYHWRGPSDQGWRHLGEAPLLNPPFTPQSVDDNGELYVLRRHGPEGLTVLSRFDFAAGQPEAQPLVSAPGFDFVGRLVLDRPGGRALGVRANTDAETTLWYDPAMKDLQAEADARLPGRVNRIDCRRCGAPDMVALLRSYADVDPGQLWLYSAAERRWEPVSRILDGIDPRQMAAVALERIRARDGRDLPVWLTLPSGVAAGKPAPAVVLVHGGPWVREGFWQWQAMEQFLASRGYLVISPEFRGSQGYGYAHYRAGWKQWGRAMQDDVADALLWARAKGLADPERACIAGASYGGYSTLMGLARHGELYRCGAAWMAVTDMQLLVKGSWWIDDDTSDQFRTHMLPELIGDVEKDAEMLRAVSPVLQAERIKAPLLLAFGEADRRVPLAHGKRLREALEAAGRPPEWVSYADEGHSWRRVATRVDFAQRLESFLARHLKAPQ